LDRRRFISTLAVGFLAAPLAAEAQPSKVARIPPSLLKRADQVIE
jgi:hypothetical protein